MQEAQEARQAALYAMGTEEALRELHDHKRLKPEVEEEVNELTRASLEATGEPIDPGKYVEPVQYYTPGGADSGLPAVSCTCGWSKRHLRMKVLQQAALKHLQKTGHRPA